MHFNREAIKATLPWAEEIPATHHAKSTYGLRDTLCPGCGKFLRSKDIIEQGLFRGICIWCEYERRRNLAQRSTIA